tara:strand:+ start:23 stop:826 length:804 start_codon:yes stop_codon:yes gene_type:complete
LIKKSEYLQFSLDLVKEVGKIHLNYFGNTNSILRKSSDIDLVTEADIKSEKLIISRIQQTYPEHSIISEESKNIINTSEYTWVIDPLDGTTNFAHNLPIFSVSIGLKKGNKTICAVVFNAAADKCFYSDYSNGSYLNDKQINTTNSIYLSDCLLATGFPYIHDSKYDLSFKIFKEFYDQTRGVRRLGAASLDLCFVAMGRFDGFYEFNLKPWDICAGSLIAKEAGCKVTDWNGNELNPDGRRILCASNEIHNKMVSILTQKKYSLFY